MKYLQGSEQALGQIFDYIGLKDFKGQVWDPFVRDPVNYKFIVRFGLEIDQFDLDVSKNMTDLYERVGAPIILAVKNSAAVQVEKAEMAEGIATLQDELDKANTEIERLKEYETYYHLHYKMMKAGK